MTNQVLGIAAGAAIRHKDTTQPKVPIFTLSGPTGVITTTANVPGLLVGETLQLLGIRRSVMPARFVRVTAVDAVNFRWTVVGLPAGVTLGPGGFVRRLHYVNDAVVQAIPERITERRDGRPFGLLRGRAAPVR